MSNEQAIRKTFEKRLKQGKANLLAICEDNNIVRINI